MRGRRASLATPHLDPDSGPVLSGPRFFPAGADASDGAGACVLKLRGPDACGASFFGDCGDDPELDTALSSVDWANKKASTNLPSSHLQFVNVIGHAIPYCYLISPEENR